MNEMATAVTALTVALITAAGGITTAVIGRRSGRGQERRDTFTVIADRLDKELIHERRQRRLLTSYVLDLLRWGRRVDPEPSDPIPEPPAELDLSPWQ